MDVGGPVGPRRDAGERGQRHRGAGGPDRPAQAPEDRRDHGQRRPGRRRREGQRRRRERLGRAGHPILEDRRPGQGPADPAGIRPGPAGIPDQGHGRGPDPAARKDQGLRKALRPGPGDRRGAGTPSQGRQDRRGLGRVDRGGPGHRDARRPRTRRGRAPRRARAPAPAFSRGTDGPPDGAAEIALIPS
ncbi:MAG: hypothetical protein MZV70_66880 [Desulfobacterales bacterium]|nr:hypothetical protein [Desulfobacterales bacterium]